MIAELAMESSLPSSPVPVRYGKVVQGANETFLLQERYPKMNIVQRSYSRPNGITLDAHTGLSSSVCLFDPSLGNMI
ncbi:Uncharacterized protein HZ326_0992 [Fusarium oxysporum f. sp. albedinis]|nr:Uncharacterized protein HZ326_0992 [Fusarium oxysporum f. sp. albedinis]